MTVPDWRAVTARRWRTAFSSARQVVPCSASWRCKVRGLTAICLATLSSDVLPDAMDWASNRRNWLCQITGGGGARLVA